MNFVSYNLVKKWVHVLVTYPLHTPSGLSLEKVDYYFCKHFKLDLDQARPKRVGLDLHLNSVRSDVDLLVMFLGEFFQNEFYANSLNQIKPDIIMSGLALRPRHARIQMGGGGRGGPEEPF